MTMATASGYASAYGMPSAELVRDDDVELTRPGLLGRFVGCFAVHDFVMLGHLTVMWVLVAGARSATGAPASLLRIEATMAILLVGCLLARGDADSCDPSLRRLPRGRRRRRHGELPHAAVVASGDSAG